MKDVALWLGAVPGSLKRMKVRKSVVHGSCTNGHSDHNVFPLWGGLSDGGSCESWSAV